MNKRKEKKADTTQIGEGEKETYLFVRQDGPSPAREKKSLRRPFAGVGEEGPSRGAAAHQARPRGRRGQAARRRRAHPLGSTRAGEGAGDGAMVAPPSSLALGVSLWLR